MSSNFMPPQQGLFNVCVFAGAAPGVNPLFAEVSECLGRALAQANYQIVYGGGAAGLMGALANGALCEGGRVVGILPKQLADLELAHLHLSEQIVVSAMHERKALFHLRSDAFVVLPGGVGTFDELFETLAWLKLGIHAKPVILINIAQYFNPMIDLLREMERQGFVEHDLINMIQIFENVQQVINYLDKVSRKLGP